MLRDRDPLTGEILASIGLGALPGGLFNVGHGGKLVFDAQGNPSRRVAGFSDTNMASSPLSTPSPHPFWWDGSSLQDGGVIGEAFNINNLNQVAGSMAFGDTAIFSNIVYHA